MNNCEHREVYYPLIIVFLILAQFGWDIMNMQEDWAGVIKCEDMDIFFPVFYDGKKYIVYYDKVSGDIGTFYNKPVCLRCTFHPFLKYPHLCSEAPK